MENSNNSISHKISNAEIKKLDDYLQSLLHDIDNKVAILESLPSPKSPRSINSSSQEIPLITEVSTSTQYNAVKDVCDPNVMDVIRYEETDTVNNLETVSNVCQTHKVNSYFNNGQNPSFNTLSLLDDISSINPDKTLFSPVQPDKPSCEYFLSNETVDNKSLNSIPSIDTIVRPTLLTSDMDQTFHVDHAFSKLDGTPFQLFNALLLDQSTKDYVTIGSRYAAYYGDYPYLYSGISHPARPYSANKYLSHIVSYIQIVLPDFKFNSAMVHKYHDGNCIMPQHSDNEESIEIGSDIVTVSLGDTRNMEFKNKYTGLVENVPMIHGEVLVMNKASQEHFMHSIPASLSNEMRISVTLRLIKPLSMETAKIDQPHSPDDNSSSRNKAMTSENPNFFQPALFDPPDGYQDNPLQPYHTNQDSRCPPAPLQHSSKRPVWVPNQRSQYSWHRQGWQPAQRSGMQSRQNLHSPSVELQNPRQPLPPRPIPPRPIPPRPAPPRPVPPRPTPPRPDPPKKNTYNISRGNEDEVLYISSSMFADLDATKMSTTKVKAHVFFYRGANSKQMMDRIKNDSEVQIIAKNNTISKVFLMTGTNNVDGICQQRQSQQDACTDISNTIQYVQTLFPSAIVNLINILPRTTGNRMNVIKDLNEHIAWCCEHDADNNLNYIDTYNIKLLTFSDGARKSTLFKCMYENDIDNVHLNRDGVIKLAKHLKYLSHC